MHKILLHFGPFTLYSYGLFVALAFLVGTVMITKDAKKIGISQDKSLDAIVIVLICALLGGRLLFVAINWKDYLYDPLRVLKFYEGGLAFQGALITAVLAGCIVAHIKKIPFWKGADLMAPYIALGQAIGRIGCLLNGCCYGRVTHCGLGMVFPQESFMRVPVQVYSSLGLLCIFVALIFLAARKGFDGRVFAVYLISYSVFRFFMDFLRGDELVSFAGVYLSQWICVGLLVCGVGIYVGRRRVNLLTG